MFASSILVVAFEKKLFGLKERDFRGGLLRVASVQGVSERAAESSLVCL